MKIFVTGGAGFIGSHIVDALIDKGDEVTVFDNLSKGRRESVNKKASFIEGDLKDFDKLVHYLEGHDAVIHLAAETGVGDSIDNPKGVLDKNIGYTINIFEATRQNNIKKIIFSSSSAIYGETSEEGVKEDAIKSPLQPYGASKLAGESILSAYYHSFGINSVSLRYFNVYGPGDDISLTTRAVPNWIKSVLSGKPLTLYWRGRQIKDYIFIKDVVNAHLAALEKCVGAQAYNVGSGEAKSMMEILETVINVSGEHSEIAYMGERKGDIQILVADINKIRSNLNWTPQYTLSEGMKITYDYYKNKISPEKSNI